VFSMDGNFFGTVFTPTSDLVTRTFTDVRGSLISGRSAIIGSSTTVDYVQPSNTTVPEPSMLSVMLLTALARPRRR
jgi:hypothetical protein